MISNYIKLAIRVLGRNKFFTAITLFGISFTLAILMLIISVLETEVGETPPLTDKDKMVILPSLQLKRQFYDTIYAYDTTMYKSAQIIDTTFTLKENGSNNSNNEFAHWFLDKHLSKVPNAKNYTFFKSGEIFNSYVNNSKVEMRVTFTDHRFWEVLDFQFVEGFGFGAQSVEREEPVAVITTDLADKYYGRTNNIIGEMIEMDGKNYKIMGLVEPAGVSLLAVDIIVPYTHAAIGSVRSNESGFGGYMAIFLGETSADIKLIKEDIKYINSKTEVPVAAQGKYDIIKFDAFGYHETYAGQILDLNDEAKSLWIMKLIMMGLIGLFILLPTLNLINLNVSRIMERSSEIGVRKAFGADQRVILTQFVIENIVQTFIGGLIGLVMAIVLLNVINEAKLMGDIILKLNLRFFIYSFLICLLFGLVSGILPAYKMSKMHVVTALKQNKL
ncbi:MAG: FtsX-like permease family protein [Saprospiraceae bacterium]